MSQFRLHAFIFAFLTIFGAVWVTAGEAPRIVSTQEISDVRAKYGDMAARRLESWQKVVDNNQNKTDQEKLEVVNNFFNQVRFIDDIVHWRQKDYWATPVELLATDGGDCEDYSIAKYFTLKALGVPESKLYITYVKAIRLNQAHMVLTYFETPRSIPLVLDNINPRILQANKRKDLVPIYSFNGDGLWLARERGRGKSVSGGTSRLKKWNLLLKRLNQ
ncbi:sulfate adenylyltransferase [Thiomicrorhabdus sediminis]|uniref:Sulfate adenylyltransferase n=2 Tax=Thiomicrorhabdus sediminis TaxID=2580412 RepID=A0A4P9K9D2_9GAMM|nr:sulfate adenylyltransferase [Thiomicrorhabdus sediminis]